MNYRLLQRVRLPPDVELKCTGLTVVVGPNSGGKTRLLRDIHAVTSGASHQFVVATHIEFEKPAELNAFLADLENAGFIATSGSPDNRTLVPQRSSAGVSRTNVVVSFSQALQWLGYFSATKLSGASAQNEFLKHFGQLLTAALFIDQRLSSVNRTGRFNIGAEGPAMTCKPSVMIDMLQAISRRRF